MVAQPRHHGIFYGWIIVAAAFIIVAMGLGAWFGGRFFDSLGTYNLMYILSFTTSGMGALLAATLRPTTTHALAASGPCARWQLRGHDRGLPLGRRV